MPGNTAKAGLRYALLADPPNENTASQDLASDCDNLVIPKYVSTAARDAANPTPTQGDMCYVSGTGRGYYCYGSSWCGPYQMDQGWQTYVPTWSTSTGSHIPTLGNGTQNFRYRVRGNTVDLMFEQVMGTTTNFNSGTSSDNWTWTFPTGLTPSSAGVTPGVAGSLLCGNPTVVRGMFRVNYDLANNRFTIEVMGSSDDTDIANQGVIDAVSPATWAQLSSNLIRGNFSYEI